MEKSKRKQLRNSGQQYVSSAGRVVSAKKFAGLKDACCQCCDQYTRCRDRGQDRGSRVRDRGRGSSLRDQGRGQGSIPQDRGTRQLAYIVSCSVFPQPLVIIPVCKFCTVVYGAVIRQHQLNAGI